MEDLTSNVSYKRFIDEESINGEIGACNYSNHCRNITLIISENTSNEPNNQIIGHSIVSSTPKESKTKESSLNQEAIDNLRDGGLNHVNFQHTSI